MNSINFVFLTMIIYIISLWQIEVNRLKSRLVSLEEENNSLRITKKFK